MAKLIRAYNSLIIGPGIWDEVCDGKPTSRKSWAGNLRHTFGLLGIAFGTVSSVGKRVRAIKVRLKIFDQEGTREVFYSKVIFTTFGGHLVV